MAGKMSRIPLDPDPRDNKPWSVITWLVFILLYLWGSGV